MPAEVIRLLLLLYLKRLSKLVTAPEATAVYHDSA